MDEIAYNIGWTVIGTAGFIILLLIVEAAKECLRNLREYLNGCAYRRWNRNPHKGRDTQPFPVDLCFSIAGWVAVISPLLVLFLLLFH
jgi:hypothetical protein